MKYIKKFEYGSENQEERWDNNKGSFVLLSINKENYDNFLHPQSSGFPKKC